MMRDKRKTWFGSVLIIVLLTLIIVSVLIILAVVRKKNVEVDMEVTASLISFSVERSSQGTKDLVTSIESITLADFREIGFSADQITYDGGIIQAQGAMLVRPLLNAMEPRAIFKGEGIILAELDLRADSRAIFRKREGSDSVYMDLRCEQGTVESNEGVISLGGSYELMLNQCDLLDGEGRVLIDGKQKADIILKISPSFNKTSFFLSDENRTLKITLKKLKEDVGLFSNAPVRNIDFYDYHNERSTIKSGSVKFEDPRIAKTFQGPGDPIDLELGDLINITERKPPAVSALRSVPEGLWVKLRGPVDSLRHNEKEKLPSVLKWLAYNKTIGIIIAIFVWVVAQAFAVRNLIVLIIGRKK